MTIFLLISFPPYNYTSFNIFPSLLHFYLLTTLYLNIIIPQSLHFPFILTMFLSILFTLIICYSLFHSIHILPTQKCEHSLYIFSYFWWIFNSLLHLYFGLINFFVELYFWLIQFGCVWFLLYMVVVSCHGAGWVWVDLAFCCLTVLRWCWLWCLWFV